MNKIISVITEAIATRLLKKLFCAISVIPQTIIKKIPIKGT
jgi:hypothetical protein